MKRLLFAGLMLLWVTNSYASPSSSMSIPNSATGGTTIESSDFNENFSEVQNKFNSHNHEDITKLGSVTVGAWGGSAVAILYGGSGQTTSHAAFNAFSPLTLSGGMIFYNSNLYAEQLNPGVSGSMMMMGASNIPTWSEDVPAKMLASGAVIGFKCNEFNKVASGTTVIPYDNTIPQDTEGDQYMTLSYTPQATANYLKIDVKCFLSNAGNIKLASALFASYQHNALAVGFNGGDTSADWVLPISYTKYYTPATTAAITFSVRCGGSAGTTTFNSQGGVSYYGNGSVPSTISITEIKG
jgi:hypothetical protein